ncbi:MAG: hypothetical protein ACLT0Y_01620 [Christensenellales bacterium]
MIGKVDGLLDIRLSKNVNGGPYDWALEGLFCSMEAVKTIRRIRCIWKFSKWRKTG